MGRNLEVSLSLTSFWAIVASDVFAVADSIAREFLGRLLAEAEERSDGLVVVLMEARLAIALDVLSLA